MLELKHLNFVPLLCSLENTQKCLSLYQLLLWICNNVRKPGKQTNKQTTKRKNRIE